jgi:hypothetical protein
MAGAFAALLVGAFPVPTAAADKATSGDIVPDRWIVTMDPGRDAFIEAPGLARVVGGASGLVFRNTIDGFVFHGTAREAGALARDPRVRSVVPDRPLSIVDVLPHGVARVRAAHPSQPDAHDAGFTGAGSRIAILDTGIDLDHPDLIDNIDHSLGRNCMGPGVPEDGHGHGTHVAGIAAATTETTVSASSASPRRHAWCRSRSSTMPAAAAGRP